MQAHFEGEGYFSAGGCEVSLLVCLILLGDDVKAFVIHEAQFEWLLCLFLTKTRIQNLLDYGCVKKALSYSVLETQRLLTKGRGTLTLRKMFLRLEFLGCDCIPGQL